MNLGGHHGNDDLAVKALLLQKRRNWAGAAATLEALRAQSDDSLLVLINVLICSFWLNNHESYLEDLDQLLPTLAQRSDAFGLSMESAGAIEGALSVAGIVAAEAVGDTEWIRATSIKIALNCGLRRLPRVPVAISLDACEVTIFEDVEAVGDVIFALIIASRGLSISREDGATIEALWRRYQAAYERSALEPLTTRTDQIYRAIGYPCPRFDGYRFQVDDWKTTPDAVSLDGPEESSKPMTKLELVSTGPVQREPPEGSTWQEQNQELADAHEHFLAVAKRSGPPADSFDELRSAIRRLLTLVPVPLGTVSEAASLYRCRAVHNDFPGFASDLSYNPNEAGIRMYGRANKPGQSVFYSSFSPRTCVAEILDEWFHAGSRGDERRVIVGRWYVQKPFQCVIVPFHGAALSKSSLRRQTVQHLYEQVASEFTKAAQEFLVRILTTFADAFAAVATSESDYLSTAAFFDVVTELYSRNNNMGLPHVPAVAYPSVRMDYAGENIAMLPTAVDLHLRLVDVQLLRFTREYDDAIAMDCSPPDWFSQDVRAFGFEREM